MTSEQKRAYDREWRQKNLKYRLEYERNYERNVRDPKSKRKKQERYRKNHRNEINEKQRQIYNTIKNEQWLKEYRRKYYQDNKEKIDKRSKSNYQRHRERILKYAKEYVKRPEVRERRWEYLRMYRRRCRDLCIEHYSNGKNKCALCPEKRHDCLTIDHVNGGGRQHRISIHRHLPEWLIRNNFPKGFRILCWNCNCSIRSK